jgi:hypothetical protein
MKTLLPLSLLLSVSFCVVAGCQKDVREVRRTDKDKYSVDTGGYAVSSGGRYEVETGRYSAAGVTQATPSAPRQRPAGLGIPARDR